MKRISNNLTLKQYYLVVTTENTIPQLVKLKIARAMKRSHQSNQHEKNIGPTVSNKNDGCNTVEQNSLSEVVRIEC